MINEEHVLNVVSVVYLDIFQEMMPAIRANLQV